MPGKPPIHVGKPKYWVDEKAGRARLLGRKQEDKGQMLDYQSYRMAFRKVARNTEDHYRAGSDRECTRIACTGFWSSSANPARPRKSDQFRLAHLRNQILVAQTGLLLNDGNHGNEMRSRAIFPSFL